MSRFEVKAEPMLESGEKRLWRVAIYKNGKFQNHHCEGLSHEEAESV